MYRCTFIINKICPTIKKIIDIYHPKYTLNRGFTILKQNNKLLKSINDIDESYDLVEDDMERLYLIQIEIDKFSNKSKEEKDQFLNDVKDICVYNQNLFLQYGRNSWKSSSENTEMEKIINFLMDGKKSLI